jgi:hypothetical protein
VSSRRLFPILVLLGVAAVVTSVWIVHTQDEAGRDEILQELPKATWQFLLVVVFGGFVSYLFDHYRDRVAEVKAQAEKKAADEAAMDQYRKELLRRTVTVTRSIRRVPLLVRARRSYRVYDQQMRAVIDAYLDLRAVGHEIDNLGFEDNAAFANWPEISQAMDAMEQYLESLTDEFAGAQSRAISKLHAQAESDRTGRSEVWDALKDLPVLGDMLAEEPRRRNEKAERPAGPPSKAEATTDYYASYLQPYGEAVKLMRAELLRRPPGLA